STGLILRPACPDCGAPTAGAILFFLHRTAHYRVGTMGARTVAVADVDRHRAAPVHTHRYGGQPVAAGPGGDLYPSRHAAPWATLEDLAPHHLPDCGTLPVALLAGQGWQAGLPDAAGTHGRFWCADADQGQPHDTPPANFSICNTPIKDEPQTQIETRKQNPQV